MLQIFASAIALLILVSSLQSNAVVCESAFKKRVVIISGTAREGSNTLKVSEIIAQYLRENGNTENIEIDVIDLSERKVEESLEIAQWVADGRPEGQRPDYWNTSEYFKKRYEDSVNLATTLLIVHPEYNGSVSGDLKTFLDQLSTPSFAMDVFTFGLSAGPRGALVPQGELQNTLAKRQAAYSQGNRIEVGFIDNFVGMIEDQQKEDKPIDIFEKKEDQGNAPYGYTSNFFSELLSSVFGE